MYHFADTHYYNAVDGKDRSQPLAGLLEARRGDVRIKFGFRRVVEDDNYRMRQCGTATRRRRIRERRSLWVLQSRSAVGDDETCLLSTLSDEWFADSEA